MKPDKQDQNKQENKNKELKMKNTLCCIRLMAVAFAMAVLLGIITVTPCAPDCKEGIALLGRSYDFDAQRVRELYNNIGNLFCKLKKK